MTAPADRPMTLPADRRMTAPADRPRPDPVQVAAEVRALRPVGAYWQLSLVAPAVAERARPGQFVAVAVGGPGSALLLRRAFAVYRARPQDGTVELVVAVHGAGTAWLVERRPGERLDVVGPLGRPFDLPAAPESAVLVGGGYGSAALFDLADALLARGCRVDMVLGAASADRLFGRPEAARVAASVTVTTEDGSAGVRGRVTDVLPDVLAAGGAVRAYACGPMGMLAAVADLTVGRGLACQVAVEESMACGIGVCMTCVLPVVGADGVTRMVRSCVDGPVFDGGAVRFADVGTVPADALGAPSPAGAR